MIAWLDQVVHSRALNMARQADGEGQGWRSNAETIERICLRENKGKGGGTNPCRYLRKNEQQRYEKKKCSNDEVNHDQNEGNGEGVVFNNKNRAG